MNHTIFQALLTFLKFTSFPPLGTQPRHLSDWRSWVHAF